MNKILTFALCAAVAGSVSAQKANVDAAKKLAGKIEKIEEARAAIKAAISNPETANLPNTYLIAADVEFKPAEKMKNAVAIDAKKADDPAFRATLSELILNGYPAILKAVEVSAGTKEEKKAISQAQKDLSNFLNDYFEAGAYYYGTQEFYPQAYNSFMHYADIPTLLFMQGKVNVPDSVRATAYYNAGLCGWSASDLRAAADAFKKARLTGAADKNPFIYELACWQNIAQNDSTAEAEARAAILDVSRDGYNTFGVAEPVFLNNMINVFVEQEQYDTAISQINSLLQQGENAALYGLRGFVYDRMDKDDESVSDYTKAVSFADCDFETLRNAGKKLLRRGTELWNDINGTTQQDIDRRSMVKNDYFAVAKNAFERGKELAPDAEKESFDELLERADYSLNSLR